MKIPVINKIGFVIVFFSFVISACVFIKPVHIAEIKSIQIEKLSVSSAKLELNLEIENPNFVNIKITGIDLDVSIENESLGKINDLEEFEIPANSNEIVKVKLDVSFSNLFAKALKIVKLLSQSDAKVKLSGTIETKAFFINKKIKVDEEDIVSLF